MPVSPTYPGVYIEEIPSGVRTITGVATSITAFVGWTAKGPTDKATLVLSWADFERRFGGLDTRSLMSYAVSHYFTNGGQRAYIVRLVMTAAIAAPAPAPPAPPAPPVPPAPPAPAASALLEAKTAGVTLDSKLKILAASPGEWANDYAIVTKKRPAPDDARFQLKIVKFRENGKDFAKPVPVEVFENLSMLPDDRRYVRSVLFEESAFVSADEPANPAGGPPADTGTPLPDAAKLTGGLAGTPLSPDKPEFTKALTEGVKLLDRIDLFNLLCVPGEEDEAVLGTLEQFCRDRRAFLIVDAKQGATFTNLIGGPDGKLTGDPAINAAFYFPWVSAPDPQQENRPREFPPCGYVAGLYARTDTNRGVWKAPAGTEASLVGVLGPKITLTDDENGVLNPQAINCIRALPVYGTVLWGARTLQGNDERGSEWKYVPVRRTALFIEETLFRALKWVVFEPNDEPLWAQIRLNVGAFMHDLFRQGAFQGATPREAYFVKCDKDTTTQSDINRGIVNIVVGFAPLKPAEFVIVKIQQIAGQIET